MIKNWLKGCNVGNLGEPSRLSFNHVTNCYYMIVGSYRGRYHQPRGYVYITRRRSVRMETWTRKLKLPTANDKRCTCIYRLSITVAIDMIETTRQAGIPCAVNIRIDSLHIIINSLI